MKRRRPSPQGYSDPIGAYCTGRMRHNCALRAAADLERLIFGAADPATNFDGIGLLHPHQIAAVEALTKYPRAQILV